MTIALSTAVLRRLVGVVLCVSACVGYGNVITDENARHGTSDWNVYSRATAGEIEGYASLTSVAHGESIRLYVRTTDPQYTIEVFRMGWYGGAGGRRMTEAVTRAAVPQPIPGIDPITGFVECNWSDPYVLSIPNDWVSGVYLAKLTAVPSRKGAWIIFVVRPRPDRNATFVAITGVTKYEAYNGWGGKSLYAYNSDGVQAVRVSFNRPYANGSGADEFLYRTEYYSVRFLEREGYDVGYATDLDLDERATDFMRASAWLDIGHDEYWTMPMRQAFENARDRGISLAFFSANNGYWQIRLEPSAVTGEADRTIVAYKETALRRDPVLFDNDPSNDRLATGLWREPPVGMPEDSLIGTMYTWTPVAGDIVIDDVSSWVFDNTNLHPGDHLVGLLGYEVDRTTSTAPPNVEILTRTRFQHADATPDESNMTLYIAPSGALVFASGTIDWNLGLDDFNASGRPASPSSAAAQQIMKNVLNAMQSKHMHRRRAVL